MRLRHLCILLLCVLIFVGSLSAQGPPPGPVRPPGGFSTQCGTESSSMVVSPVAMASWVLRVERDGARTLAFLVLWRGSPSWFARGSGSGASGGGNCRTYHSTISRGDVQLQIEFDSQTRVATISQALFTPPAGAVPPPEQRATIQKKQIELRDQNVVLIDAVDSAPGAQIVGTLRVDSTLPSGNSPQWIFETLRSSKEITSFLQCDIRLADPLSQKLSETVCAIVLGQ